MIVVPVLQSEPFQRIALPIDTTQYLIDLRWNSRDSAWYMDVFESDETSILHGARVVLGMYLGRRARVRHPLFADGVFIAVDTSGEQREAGLDDLGTRVELRYYNTFELASAILGALE